LHAYSGVRPFDVESRLIAKDAELDIATFRVTKEEVAQAGATILTANKWPPPLPLAEQPVLRAGFPGCERRQPGIRQIDFGKVAGVTIVHRVDHRGERGQGSRGGGGEPAA
jgi:hypothetical protein